MWTALFLSSINLKLSNLYVDEQFVRVMGKGSKERLVPISPRALEELNYWFSMRNEMSINLGKRIMSSLIGVVITSHVR